MENLRLLFLKVLWFVVLCESEVTSGCSVSVFAPQVITYSGGRVYDDLNEEQKGRVSFTSNFLAGDASLQIISLQSSDAGKYICKVKKAGQYEWVHITLKVVGKVILLFFWTTTTKNLQTHFLEGDLFQQGINTQRHLMLRFHCPTLYLSLRFLAKNGTQEEPKELVWGKCNHLQNHMDCSFQIISMISSHKLDWYSSLAGKLPVQISCWGLRVHVPGLQTNPSPWRWQINCWG